MLLSMWTEIALVVGSLALAYAVAIHFHYNEYARKTNDRVQNLSSLMSALNEHRQEEITELIERVDAAAKEVQEFKRTSVLTQKLFDDRMSLIEKEQVVVRVKQRINKPSIPSVDELEAQAVRENGDTFGLG